VLALVMLATSCADRGDPSLQGDGGIAVSVAPLDLEQIGFACYDLELFALDETGASGPVPTPLLVWQRGNPNVNRADDFGNFAGDADTLCSNLYGSGPGGDIFFVGTCDATYPNHVLRVVVDGLYRPTGGRLPEPDDWQNPCPASSPCEFLAKCNENADTPLLVDLTVLRSANQGFFDIAVRFDEIFCSAKVDCTWPTDEGGTQPIPGLHNADGEPGPTAVIGFACTAGPGEDTSTELFVNPPRIECGGDPIVSTTASYAMCAQTPDGTDMFTYYEYLQYRVPSRRAEAIRDYVFQHYEGSIWPYSLANDNTWYPDEPMPLVEATSDGTYAFFFPLLQPIDDPGGVINRDLVLGVACNVGTPPAVIRLPFPTCRALRLATVRYTDGAWNELHVLPGLEAFDFAWQHRYDATTRAVVVTSATSDGTGFTHRAHIFSLDAGEPSGYAENLSQPLPAGSYVELRDFADETAVTADRIDGSAPVPWGGPEAYHIAHVGADGHSWRVEITPGVLPLPYNAGDIAFTDNNGCTWTLQQLMPDNGTYVVAHHEVLMRGYFTSSCLQARELPVRVVLNGEGSMPPLGLKLAPFHFAFDDMSTVHNSNQLQWFEVGSMRGFRYQFFDGGTSRDYLSLVANDPPYGGWDQWRVEPPGGTTWNWFGYERVIESPSGGHHLVTASGSYQETELTAQPCVSLNQWSWECQTPPPTGSWNWPGFCRDMGGFGQCEYRGAWRNERWLGWLDPAQDDVQWIQKIDMPAGFNDAWIRDVKPRADGMALVFGLSGNREGLMVLWVRQTDPGTSPEIIQVQLLEGTTVDMSVEYDRTIKGLLDDDRYTFDARFRDALDGCATTYDGAGYSTDGGGQDLGRTREWTLLGWNTESPGTYDPGPPEATEWTAFAFAPSANFQNVVAEREAWAAANAYQYAVLDLNHPEGQGQFFSYPDNPPPEGFPLFQYATYFDDEALMCDGEPCNKMFFNMALGLLPEYDNCMLAFEGTTAQPGVIAPENDWSLEGRVHPIVVVRVNLTPPESEHGVCGVNPLNAETSGVRTVYARPGGLEGKDLVFPFSYRVHMEDTAVLDDLRGGNWAWGFDWVDGQPRKRGDGFTGLEKEKVAQNTAPLTFREGALEVEGSPIRRIAQFEETWPDCSSGYIYDPDMFDCVAVCGDQQVVADEACDDGNTVSGDGCSSDCRREVTCPGTTVSVPVAFICDGYIDCPGAVDEAGTTCFTCDDPRDRIFAGQRCDGTVDCASGRDEEGCPSSDD
jgi:cysteine-rich repeat protein